MWLEFKLCALCVLEITTVTMMPFPLFSSNVCFPLEFVVFQGCTQSCVRRSRFFFIGASWICRWHEWVVFCLLRRGLAVLSCVFKIDTGNNETWDSAHFHSKRSFISVTSSTVPDEEKLGGSLGWVHRHRAGS